MIINDSSTSNFQESISLQRLLKKDKLLYMICQSKIEPIDMRRVNVDLMMQQRMKIIEFLFRVMFL